MRKFNEWLNRHPHLAATIFGVVSGVFVLFVYLKTSDIDQLGTILLPGLVYGIVSSILFRSLFDASILKLTAWTIACSLSFLCAILSALAFMDSIPVLQEEVAIAVIASITGSSILLLAFSILFCRTKVLHIVQVIFLPLIIAFLYGVMASPQNSVDDTLSFLFLFISWQTTVTLLFCNSHYFCREKQKRKHH